MLEIRNVSVSYGDKKVVSGASLLVPSGAITVIVGPNGVGKTTFLRAVCGLLPVSSGQIVLDGSDITRVPTHKRGIGMLFQSTQLFPALDVGENIEFGLRNARPRVNTRDTETRVEEALDIVDMHAHRHSDVTALSGGQARRVDIARMLAPRPRALLCDEPMSMLDADTIERVIPRFRKYVIDHGIAVVYITHDADEAKRVGDVVRQFSDITTA